MERKRKADYADVKLDMYVYTSYYKVPVRLNVKMKSFLKKVLNIKVAGIFLGFKVKLEFSNGNPNF